MGKSDKWDFNSLVTHLKKYLSEDINYEVSYLRSIIADLIGIGFIGIKVSEDRVEYADTVSKSKILRSKVINHPLDQKLDFVIHPIFYKYLNLVEFDISESDNRENDKESLQNSKLVKEEISTDISRKETALTIAKNLWKDPVWSKVIATVIITILGIAIIPITNIVQIFFK